MLVNYKGGSSKDCSESWKETTRHLQKRPLSVAPNGPSEICVHYILAAANGLLHNLQVTDDLQPTRKVFSMWFILTDKVTNWGDKTL